MMMSGREEDPRAARSRSLIQTTLSPSFFGLKNGRNDGKSSPYFTKPPSTSNPNDVSPSSKINPPVDLHTSRRANPKNRPAPSLTSFRSSISLSSVAAETKSLLPNILQITPNAPPTGELCTPNNLPHLSPDSCPKLSSTPVRVRNADSIDAALELRSQKVSVDARRLKSDKPVLVLNMANAEHPGGGWLHGALAQEEALCYRSSLSFTLKRRFYPLPERSGVYSPSVVVVRESFASGHDLLDLSRPEDLPIISVVSVAAICGPDVGKTRSGEEKYRYPADRVTTKEKMRMILRIAAHNGHHQLVLGALGCGAFENPKEEVAQCWKEVLGEGEFAGGWWESVVFAVMDNDESTNSSGNFGVFWRALGGLEV